MRGRWFALAGLLVAGCAPGPPPYEASLPTGAGFDDGAAIRVQLSATEPTPELFAFSARQLGVAMAVQGGELFASAPLVMFFVGPDCRRCARDAKHLARLAHDHPDVVFVGVHTDGTDAEIQDFVTAAGFSTGRGNVKHLVDDERSLRGRFDAGTEPTYVLIDRSGLARIARGELEQQGISEAVDLVTAGMSSAG